MKALISILTLGVLLFASCEESAITPEKTYVPGSEVSSLQNQSNGNYTGFDEWGFNYTAQIFDSYLINALIADPAFKDAEHYRETAYKGEGSEYWDNFISNYPYFQYWMPAGLLDCRMKMKWNDALLPPSGIYPDSWNNTDAKIEFKYMMDSETENWMQIRKLIAIFDTDYLEGDRWYNENGEEIGMKSYYWPDELIIVQVLNVGENPYVPFAMPPDYTAPFGHGWGSQKNR